MRARGDAADRASYDAKLEAIRAEVKSQFGTTRAAMSCRRARAAGDTWDDASPGAERCDEREMVAEIKQELPERDGPAAGAAAARPPVELRRAVHLRQLRQDQLRDGGVSRRRLLRHRQARGGRAQ